MPRRIGLSLAAVTAAVALSACSHSGNLASSAPPSNPPSPSAAASVSRAAVANPGIVAVTSAGALVTLNPTTGAVERTLVPSGVAGEEVSVSASGMVYFAVNPGACSGEIEEIPLGGGNAAVVASGYTPAVSPDGTKLAYTTVDGCGGAVSILQIRTLSNGATISMPDSPTAHTNGLFPRISRLSWAADDRHLAVSIPQIQDNEGWALNIVDTAQARYYASGTGFSSVPVTGNPSPQASYFEEGVYMPNGDLFVSRACCAGVPVQNTSLLMWEVTTSGAFVHQVAIGYSGLSHFSLDVSSDGNWLLYLAAGAPNTGALYVSQGGATPRELTTGIVAAAWS